jgi:hypothetical protein
MGSRLRVWRRTISLGCVQGWTAIGDVEYWIFRGKCSFITSLLCTRETQLDEDIDYEHNVLKKEKGRHILVI